MGDLESVLEAILNGAKTRETEIYDNLKRRINIINMEFEKEKSALRERFQKELEKETDSIYESSRAKDRQMIKNAEIKAKSDFVLDVISSAKERIYELEDIEYAQFLKGIYKECADEKENLVYLNKEDKKRALKGVFGRSKIADEDICAKGGFVAVCKNIRYDFTLDSIFEEEYDEICDKINALCRKERQ